MLSALKPAAIANGMLAPTAKGPLELSAARRQASFHNDPSGTGAIPLRLRVVESLIADYLQRQRLEYTLSIFQTESSLGDAGKDGAGTTALTPGDALTMLRVDRGTRLFEWLLAGPKNSGNHASSSSSTLVRLCDHVKRLQGAGMRSSACQTDDAGRAPASERLYERLAALEHVNTQDSATTTAVTTTTNSTDAFRDHMALFQRECNARCEDEVASRVGAFKSGALRRAEEEQRATYLAKARALRANLQREYAASVEDLKARHARERDAMERSKKDLDRAAFEQRQRFLDEMRKLSAREEESRRLAQVDARSLEVERTRLRDVEAELRRKLAEHASATVARNRKWGDEMESFKQDLLRRYAER
jgi:hypothetical protein